MAQAGGNVDAGLGINIPCINVNGIFYEISLVPWSNPSDPGGYYWQLDEDSPCGTGDNACKHWAVFNIPASVTEFAKDQEMTAIPGAAEGVNWEGMTGYTGPCPPNQHTYTFTVYALSAGMPVISQGRPMTRSQFESAYKAYIIESATLQGLFSPWS